MEIETKPMTAEDIEKTHESLERSLRIFKKIALYLFGMSAIILFVPVEILKLFTRSKSANVSGILFNDLGLENVLLYIALPICFLLIWIYLYGANSIKKDLKLQIKEIGRIRVLKIEVLDPRTKKDLLGTADHLIKFEENPFKIEETFFLAGLNPDWLEAKEFVVEVSKIARIEFKRKLITK